MTCKVEGCHLSRYHYNPEITPLLKFHGKVVRNFHSLPYYGKAAAIAKRIVRIVTAPFFYLAFGIAALIGLACNASWKKSHNIEIQEKIEKLKKIEASQGLTGMINALGGQEVYENIPEMENWAEDIGLEDMTAPVIRGTYGDGEPFFLFSYLVPEMYFSYDSWEGGEMKSGKFKRSGEIIVWIEEQGKWVGGSSDYEGELNFRAPNGIKKGSLLEKQMLDNGKPLNKDHYRPACAYLTGEELDAFMDEECLYYEEEVEWGTTDLFLYDPSRSKEENLEALYAKCEGYKGSDVT